MQNIVDAVVSNNIDEVRELIAGDSGLVNRGFPEQFMLESIAHWIYAGDTLLHLASAAHRSEMVGLLIAAGADVGARSRRKAQPPHYAADGYPLLARWNPSEQVRSACLLLDAGAAPDGVAANGATPLHRAVRTRSADMVRCLLDAGAAADARNKSGSAAFNLAVQDTGRGGSGTEVARQAQQDIVAAFMERGVSADLQDGKGRSVRAAAKADWLREMLEG